MKNALLLSFLFVLVGCGSQNQDSAQQVPMVSAWAQLYGDNIILPEKIYLSNEGNCEDGLPGSAVELGSDQQHRRTRRNCYPVIPAELLTAEDLASQNAGEVRVDGIDHIEKSFGVGSLSLSDAFSKAIGKVAGMTCVKSIYLEGISTIGRLAAGQTQKISAGNASVSVLDDANIDTCAHEISKRVTVFKVHFILDYARVVTLIQQ